MRAGLVEPVRVDHGNRERQQRLGDMVVDDDEVEPRHPRRLQRIVRGGAAIDADDEAGALFLQLEQGRDVGPIAFAHAVGNVDRAVRADCRKKPQQQRRRGRAVDIVVAEDDDLFAVADGAH